MFLQSSNLNSYETPKIYTPPNCPNGICDSSNQGLLCIYSSVDLNFNLGDFFPVQIASANTSKFIINFFKI